MFLGRYQHTLDDKGRLTVPARYRQLLAEGGYIAQGFGQNLMVMRVPTFESLAEQINHTSLTDPKTVQMRQVFFSTAEFFEPDKSGRILVPQSLRTLHNLEGELALVGMGSHFDIWPQDMWPVRDDELQIALGTAGHFKEYDLHISFDGK